MKGTSLKLGITAQYFCLYHFKMYLYIALGSTNSWPCERFTMDLVLKQLPLLCLCILRDTESIIQHFVLHCWCEMCATKLG